MLQWWASHAKESFPSPSVQQHRVLLEDPSTLPSWLTRDHWSDIHSKGYKWCSFATSTRELDCYIVQRPAASIGRFSLSTISRDRMGQRAAPNRTLHTYSAPLESRLYAIRCISSS